MPDTVWVPTLKLLPEAGLDTIVDTLQLSLAVTLKFTTALQLVASLVWVISDGQVIDGISLSVTVTLKVQEFVLPFTSVAVLVTDVVPTM